jgi:hypothetical protein
VSQESTPRATARVPGQRDPATSRGAHAAPDPDEEVVAAPDETVILPAFITGRSEPLPERPREPQPAPGDALPPSERGMLIFVASLLGLGTLAVVVVLGLGGFSAPAATIPPVPTPAGSSSESPSPSPSPSASASPSLSPSPSRSPRRSPSPTHRLLGTLGAKDPAAYCTSLDAGRVQQHSDHSWYCRGSFNHPDPLPFTSTDVCRWRYVSKTAYAVAANIDDPTTWKCYT